MENDKEIMEEMREETGPAMDPPGGGQAKKSFIRPCGGWSDMFLIAALLSFLLIEFGGVISNIILGLLPTLEFGMRLVGDIDILTFLLMYFDFFGIWIIFIVVVLLFKNNRPMWKAFFYNGHGNNIRSILIGFLLGFAMNGFCVLMSWLQGDIKLSFYAFDPKLFFLFLFCVMIQSGAEEIVDRCYLYQKLRRRYRWPVIAVLVNALIFMALHLLNPGVTTLALAQIFLFGVLASLMIYYFDSLWAAIWMHTGWNFTQSIIFGLPNSGIVSKYSVFKLEAASARDGIFYNTGFGVEGSPGANAVLGAVIVFLLIFVFVTKRGEKKDHWAELEAAETGKDHIWEAVILAVVIAAVAAGSIYISYWVRNNQEAVEQIMEAVESSMNEEEAPEDGAQEAETAAASTEASTAADTAAAADTSAAAATASEASTGQ